MPMGANAWRFKLAEEEEKRRRQLGFKDIMDLLMTGFQAYQGVQGIKQGREGQELAREKFDADVQTNTMGALSSGRTGVWDRAPEDYAGPPPPTEVAGPQGRMQFRPTPPPEYPEVPGQVHVGEGKYVRSFPEEEPFVGAPPPPVDVMGQKAVNWTQDKGWDYEREYAPGSEGSRQEWRLPNGELVPTGFYNEYLKDEHGVGRRDSAWDAAVGQVQTMYPYGPPKDVDVYTLTTNLAATNTAMRTLELQAEPEMFNSILMAGNDPERLGAIVAQLAGANADPALTSALDTLIEVLKKSQRR